jgi:hypothetical protein
MAACQERNYRGMDLCAGIVPARISSFAGFMCIPTSRESDGDAKTRRIVNYFCTSESKNILRVSAINNTHSVFGHHHTKTTSDEINSLFARDLLTDICYAIKDWLMPKNSRALC